jgi:hypothetical protein
LTSIADRHDFGSELRTREAPALAKPEPDSTIPPLTWIGSRFFVPFDQIFISVFRLAIAATP